VFLGGQAVSMLGDGLALLAVPLLVLQLTRSPVAAVLASLPGSVGYLAAGLPAGVLVDRLDPWRVLIAGDVIRAAIFGALFLLTGSRLAPAWLILSLAFTAGAVTVFSDTALTIAVRDVFAGARLVTANSWLESANQAGQIIGPSVAGLLAAAGLLHVSMLIDALTFPRRAGLAVRGPGLVPAVMLGAASSGLALLLIGAATSMPVALAGNLLYTWAIIVASVTMRSMRQVLVPRGLLGRVTASWRLGGQGVTLVGALLAGAVTGLLGGDPRPVFAAAGALTLVTVTVAWFAGLRREELPASILAS
jgi:hypothetical protein